MSPYLQSAQHGLAVFLLFLALTKLLETGFVLLTNLRNKTPYQTTRLNAVTDWLSLSYLLTQLVFIVA